MAEHKTIQKHFPAAFRSMRCLSCGHDTTKGKVFRNILKPISSKAYLGVKEITLHCKCPGCATAIIIETDPKNGGYRIVKEAKRDNERAKDTEEQRLDRLEIEQRGEDGNPTMETLERRTDDANAEVAVADALDEVRAANARREKVDAKLNVATRALSKDAEGAEVAEIARAAFKGAKSSPGSEPQEESVGVEFSASRPAKKVKKDFAKAF
ncbi:unnamed protein product [Alternaria alternata]